MEDRDTRILVNGPEHAHQGVFERYVRPMLAEFVGTTVFVFIGCLSMLDGSPPALAIGGSTALAHGFLMTLLVATFANISGGHFNPAVTMGVVLSREIRPVLAAGYMGAQILGGLLGAALVRGVLPERAYVAIHGGVQHLKALLYYDVGTITAGWGIMIEMLLTSVLVLTVLMTAVNPRTKTPLAPLAIGFAIVVDIFAGEHLTGASMNPARTFGPAVCASAILHDEAWSDHYVYWVGPILGSLLAAILYNLFFADASKRFIARRPY